MTIEAFLNPIEEQVIDLNDELIEQSVRQFDPPQDDIIGVRRKKLYQRSVLNKQ
jgi:hypothetical protein